MDSKPPYLSGGRGRGQNTAKKAGYSVGGVYIDRRADSHKSKPTKTTVTNKRTNAMESVTYTEIDSSPNDTSEVEEQVDSHEEQIMKKVLKSYKEGSSSGEYTLPLYISVYCIQ